MQKLIRLLLGDRRGGAVREPVRRTAYIFDRGRPLGEARILDQSACGFRIAPLDAVRIPDAFTLLEVDTALAHEVEVARRMEGELGVQVLSEQRLRGYVPPEYQALKTFWESAAVITA